jgi:hypothetical protein
VPPDVTSSDAVAEDTRQLADTLVRLQKGAAMTRHIHTVAGAVHILALVDLHPSMRVVVAVAGVEGGSRVVDCGPGEDSRGVVPRVVPHTLQLQAQMAQVPTAADCIRHRSPVVRVGVQNVRSSHPWCHTKNRWLPA